MKVSELRQELLEGNAELQAAYRVEELGAEAQRLRGRLRECIKERTRARVANGNAHARATALAHRSAEATTLIRELLPLAERMARAAEVLTDGHASEHQPLIDRATEWLRRMP